MFDYELTLPICVFTLVGSILRFFRAEKHFYLNEELFMYTPEHDVENVKKKHRKIWLCLFAFSFFPLALLGIDALFALLAPEDVYEAYNVAKIPPLMCMFISVWDVFMYRSGSVSEELKESGKTVGRYMVYPKPGYLAVQMASLLVNIVVYVGSMILASLSVELEQISSNQLIMLIAELLFLSDLANYSIIRYYYFTPRELVLDETTESDYDAVAKRYYGIWRNRLILANVVVGAQLIFGGLVTLTNGMEHLTGIRILGLVILATVFIYILIQSRSFHDPVVVNGMVYPSEKKRVMTKWVLITALLIYLLGAVILI